MISFDEAHIFELMHLYLDDALNEDSLKQFEDKLQNDSSLSENIHVMEVEYFLTGMLNERRTKLMEEKLAADKDFAEEVQDHADMMAMLNDPIICTEITSQYNDRGVRIKEVVEDIPWLKVAVMFTLASIIIGAIGSMFSNNNKS